jgi:hypothetical protein
MRLTVKIEQVTGNAKYGKFKSPLSARYHIFAALYFGLFAPRER